MFVTDAGRTLTDAELAAIVCAADDLVNERAVAARLGVSPSTLRRMRFRGEGPPVQPFGRLVRYRWLDVSAWLDRRAAA